MPGARRRFTLTPPTSLLGVWDLRRRVADLRAGTFGRVHGTLTLALDGPDIVWSEAGLLRWSGSAVPVTRRYLLRDGADGWWVYFDDGRPFHPWAPGRTVEHPCRADVYRGVVRVDAPDRWRIAWDVVGPGKHQRILTRLTVPGRAGAPRLGYAERNDPQEDR